MKHIAVLAAMLLPLSSSAGELRLALHGAGSSGKNLYLAVHSSSANFLAHDDNAIRRVIVATGDSTELLIPNVPAGEYAVAVFADMNGNGVLDSNFFGIPTEPVGVSRNAKGRFGPPKFADAAFKMGDGVTALAIELK